MTDKITSINTTSRTRPPRDERLEQRYRAAKAAYEAEAIDARLRAATRRADELQRRLENCREGCKALGAALAVVALAAAVSLVWPT